MNALPMKSWAPAPMRFFEGVNGQKRGPLLGQSNFTQSNFISIATDGVALTTSAYLAWTLSAQQNRWAAFWWVFSGVAFIKTLNDVSKAT